MPTDDNILYYLAYVKSQAKHLIGLSDPTSTEAQLSALAEIKAFSRDSDESIVQVPFTNAGINALKKLICIRALCEFFHLNLPLKFPSNAVNLLQEALFKNTVGVHLAWEQDHHLPFNDIIEVTYFAFTQDILDPKQFHSLHGLMHRLFCGLEAGRDLEQLHLLFQIEMPKLHSAFAEHLTEAAQRDNAPRPGS